MLEPTKSIPAEFARYLAACRERREACGHPNWQFGSPELKAAEAQASTACDAATAAALAVAARPARTWADVERLASIFCEELDVDLSIAPGESASLNEQLEHALLRAIFDVAKREAKRRLRLQRPLLRLSITGNASTEPGQER